MRYQNVIALRTFSLLILLVPNLVKADTLSLNCEYSGTVDDDGKITGTSGEDHFTVIYDGSGKALIREDGLGTPYIGEITENEIRGEAEHPMNDTLYSHQYSLIINRYTGEMTKFFSTKVKGKKGKGGLVH